MQFLNPFFLFGFALVAAPVIIHLLNRRRYRIVDWAPMKYLEQTLKKNRRRLRLEQWILLAMRMLVILLAILAWSRPTVTTSAGLASLVAGRDRVSRFIVLDDSLSMGATYDATPLASPTETRTTDYAGGSAFARARQAVAELLDQAGAQDSVALLLATDPDRPLLQPAHRRDDQPLGLALDEVTVTDAAARWPAVFEALDRQLDAAPFPRRQVVLVTDLRQVGWSEAIAPIAARWQAGAAQVQLIIIDVAGSTDATGGLGGAGGTGNTAILALRSEAPLALVNTPVRFVADLAYAGDTPLAGARAQLQVDDEARTLVLPEMTPGEVTRFTFEATVSQPGEHLLTLRLPDDILPGDNVARLVIHAREALDITLVDGQPDPRPFAGETAFLELAYRVGRENWRVRHIDDAAWLNAPLTEPQPDALVLANVAAMSPIRAEAIRQRVQAGMGVMIFAGDRMDLQAWNPLAFGPAALLPVAMTGIGDQPFKGMTIEDLPDSSLAPLAALNPSALAGIPVRKVMLTEPVSSSTSTSGSSLVSLTSEGDAAATSDESLANPNAPVRVLARWSDPAATPAVIERRIGLGRVLFWSVAADRQWSDWPVDPTYVLAVREAAMRLASGRGAGRALVAGSLLSVQPNDPAVRDAMITLPEQDEPAAMTYVPPGDAAGRTQAATSPVAFAPPPTELTTEPTAGSLQWEHTRHAGVYAITWRTTAGEQFTRQVVNPDTTESELARLPESQLATWLPGVDLTIVTPASIDNALAGPDRELWRTLLLLAAALMLGESAFAAWVGRPQ